MKNENLRMMLRTSVPQPTLKSATQFWADFNRLAAETADETGTVFVPKPRSWFAGFYPALASAASVAACVALYFTVQHKTESFHTLDSFSLGSEFKNHGAVVITDGPTDATILWVMTNEEKK